MAGIEPSVPATSGS